MCLWAWGIGSALGPEKISECLGHFLLKGWQGIRSWVLTQALLFQAEWHHPHMLLALMLKFEGKGKRQRGFNIREKRERRMEYKDEEMP